MPYETWGCSICGDQAPKELRKHGKFKERMEWLRNHYKTHHPDEYRKWLRKVAEAKKVNRR